MTKPAARRIAAICAATLLVSAGLGTLSARAADLDAPAPARAPRVIAGVAPPRAYGGIPPNCRIIAQPQFNLSKEEVVRAQPQMICMSRGIYADSYYQ